MDDLLPFRAVPAVTPLSRPTRWGPTRVSEVLLGAVGDHGGAVVAGAGGDLADTQQGDSRTGQRT